MRSYRDVPLLGLALMLLACGDKDPVDPDLDATPASFELSVPELVAEGEPFPITVTAVGSSGARPVTGFSGTIELSTSAGSITPAALTLSGGVGTASFTLSGQSGDVSLGARHGTATGSAPTTVLQCGQPPAVPAIMTEDASEVDTGEFTRGTHALNGPTFTHSSISAMASVSGTVNGFWSPAVNLSGHSRDRVRLLPLVVTTTEWLIAQVHLKGSATASISGGAPFDGTATIVVESYGLAELRVNATVQNTNPSAAIDEVIPVWFRPNEWTTLEMLIGGRVRHRGAGSVAVINANLTFTMGEVSDEDGVIVPVMVCSGANASYGG